MRFIPIRPFARPLVLCVAALVACTETSVVEPGMQPSVLPITIRVTPGGPTVPAGGTRQFTARISNSVSGVTWSASDGSIDANGLFTAPMPAGTYTVAATSAEDPTVVGTATVTIPVIVVSTSVSEAAMGPNRTMRFYATVSGVANRAVTWSATGGTLIPSGTRAVRYKAPGVHGAYSLTATSVADPTKSATISITVEGPATITLGRLRCALQASSHAAAESMDGTDADQQSQDVGEGGVDCGEQPANTYNTSAVAVAGGSGSGAGNASYTFSRNRLEWTGSGDFTGGGTGSAPSADMTNPYYHGSGGGNGSGEQVITFTISNGTGSITLSATLTAACQTEASASATVRLSNSAGLLDQRMALCESATIVWDKILPPEVYRLSISGSAQGGGTGTTRVSCEIEHFPYSCGDPGPISLSATNTASFTYTVRLRR